MPENQEQKPIVMVGIAEPEAAAGLIDLAVSIALSEGHEVIAVHVVDVPPQAHLGSVRGSPEMIEARTRLLAAIRQASARDVSVRGVVEVARDVAEGLVSAADTQGASLILVGYSDPDGEVDGDDEVRAFNRVMHQVARNAQADLAVARLRHDRIGSILLPINRGRNLSLSGMLARTLSRANDAPVSIVHLLGDDEDEAETRQQIESRLAKEGLDDLGDLMIEPLDAETSPVDGIIALADRHDLAILGASPRPSISESIFGGWPERIAREASCSTLVVRARNVLERSQARDD